MSAEMSSTGSNHRSTNLLSTNVVSEKLDDHRLRSRAAYADLLIFCCASQRGGETQRFQNPSRGEEKIASVEALIIAISVTARFRFCFRVQQGKPFRNLRRKNLFNLFPFSPAIRCWFGFLSKFFIVFWSRNQIHVVVHSCGDKIPSLSKRREWMSWNYSRTKDALLLLMSFDILIVTDVFFYLIIL